MAAATRNLDGGGETCPLFGVIMGIKFKKPSGVVMEVNDTPENRAFAKAHGWTEVKGAAKKAVKKAVRKKAK